MTNENDVLNEVSVDHPLTDDPTFTEPSGTAQTFAEAGVAQDIIEVIHKMGWSSPTAVQGMCLPLTLKGRDVAGFAQTGTGKTGVFIITVAQRMHDKTPPERTRAGVAVPEVIVLTPTRELAMQIDDDAKKILEPMGIRSMPIFGGVDLDKQANEFKKAPRMIVATPGRLKDFYQRKLLDLSQVSILICDEADRMFDMGFVDDVEFVLDKIPEDAQKLLFSATTNENVKELAFEYLNDPSYISVQPDEITPERIKQHAIICDATNKLQVMLGLFREHQPECAIIFTNTKMVAEWLQFKLAGNGINVDLITGDLPQRKRISLIQRIKKGEVKALIATDVASRGLHISKVSHVYNFDVPEDPANYVHRIGRTARAGESGRSYTLVCDDYGENMIAVQEMLGPNIAPKGEWFNPEYLEIKDMAGNPYAVGGALYRSPKERDDKRAGASARDDKRGFAKGDRGGKRDRPQDGKGKPSQGKVHSKDQRHPKHSKIQKAHDFKSSYPTRHTAPQPVAQPKGLWSWIKTVFKALFK